MEDLAAFVGIIFLAPFFLVTILIFYYTYKEKTFKSKPITATIVSIIAILFIFFFVALMFDDIIFS